MFPIVHGHRALEGQCLAISTYFTHQTKPFQYISILFLKPHLNHLGQCQVTQASGQ